MQSHRAVVQRYYEEVWCKGNLKLIDELMSTDYENCDPATPGGVLRGREAMKGLVMTFREAMPDLRLDILEQYTDGDTVVSRWNASGTQRGALMGIPPTGKHASGIEGITITSFANGRIVRDRAIWDLAGLLRVLEVLPG